MNGRVFETARSLVLNVFCMRDARRTRKVMCLRLRVVRMRQFSNWLARLRVRSLSRNCDKAEGPSEKMGWVT